MADLVNDSGKKLVEEVKSSANPAGLKFVKNEDISSLLNQAKVGVLTAVPVTPDVSHATIQFKKKELTTITEVEVSSCLLFMYYIVIITIFIQESGESPSWTVGSVVIAKWSEDR